MQIRRCVRRLGLLSALAVLGATGCSVLIDTDPYLGDGPGDASVDGSSDAGADPNGPSAPVVHIEPSSPTTDDDLTVVIDSESVDPLGAGVVTYEYRWTRDGEDAAESAATVSASATAKGESWVVFVTPVAADGERRGAQATAEVTIGNLPPSLAYLGLDSYRPIDGEVLQAMPGPVDDPDGDPVRIDYSWFSDDVVIDGVTGPRLTVTTAMVGTRIRVAATPNDMTDTGATLEAGPAIVLSDETRWRQLLPNRTFREGDAVAYDARNQRVLIFDAPGGNEPMQVWELSTAAEGAFVQLFPDGVPPPTLSAPSVVRDDANSRILFFGGIDLAVPGFSNRIFAFDFAVRGSEHWVELTPTGEVPEARAFSASAYDAERRQVIFFGGGGSTSFDDLWTLDVSTPGFESWTEHDVPTPGPLGGVGLVIDASHDRAFLIGGGAADIYELNLDDMSTGFVALGTGLPRSLFGPTIGSDDRNGRAIIAFGVGDGLVPSTDFYALDYETLSVSTLEVAGPAPTQGGFGFIDYDPYGDRLIVFPGSTAADEHRPLDILALAGTELDYIHQYGLDAPAALTGGAAAAGNSWILAGGETVGGELADGVWRFDFGRHTWSRSAPLADAITGGVPEPRARVRAVGRSSRAPVFWGGWNGTTAADASVWLLNERSDTESEWVERTLQSGETPITVREWASIFEMSCETRIGVFGGRTGASLSSETNSFRCTDSSGLRECAWSTVTTSGPSSRYGAGSATLFGPQEVVIFGGMTATGAEADVWTLNSCPAPGSPWSSPTVSGVAPAPRWGHSMSAEGGFASLSVMVFGGRDDDSSTDFSDVFRLVREGGGSFRWESVEVADGEHDAVISGRYAHAAALEEAAVVPRLLVYGGTHAGKVMSDFWELRLR